MRPDTQLSDEMATVSETAYPIEASRRPISGRTLPEPVEVTAIFTLEPRTKRSRKVWALLTSEVRGCRFAAAQGRRRRERIAVGYHDPGDLRKTIHESVESAQD